jgi:hypothetical protein
LWKYLAACKCIENGHLIKSVATRFARGLTGFDFGFCFASRQGLLLLQNNSTAEHNVCVCVCVGLFCVYARRSRQNSTGKMA